MKKEFVVKKWKPVGCSVDWSAEMSVFTKTKLFSKGGRSPKKDTNGDKKNREPDRQRNINKCL